MASITNQELISFVMGMKAKFGIDFSSYSKKKFEKNINTIQKQHDLDSMFKVWGKVLKEKSFAEDFLAQLLNSTTSFFRDPSMWQKIKKHVSTHFKNKDILNIWHAGCSTGEEAYSMAILLEEIELLSRSQLIATDINDYALTKAKEGQYCPELQKIAKEHYEIYNPKANLLKYFRMDTMLEKLKEHIIFRKDDLVNSRIEGDFDIIFFRNVLPAFNEDLKIKVLNMFATKLEKKGLLVLGNTDKLPLDCTSIFEPYDEPNGIYSLTF